MDFDIDAVLDQLEKTSKWPLLLVVSHIGLDSLLVNQSDIEERETSPLASAALPYSTSRKSVDELLLLDLDPLAPTANADLNEQDQEEKLQRLKQDIQELYASSAIIHPPHVPAAPLPDVVSQPEDSSTLTLPAAVEQLELEVRQEILQHTLELPSLMPDLTTIVNGNHDEHEEESLHSTPIEEEEEEDEELNTPIVEPTDMSNTTPLPSEPDLLQHETPIVLHSVDSIVNAPTAFDLSVKSFFTSSSSNHSFRVQLSLHYRSLILTHFSCLRRNWSSLLVPRMRTRIRRNWFQSSPKNWWRIFRLLLRHRWSRRSLRRKISIWWKTFFRKSSTNPTTTTTKKCSMKLLSKSNRLN